jgi:radical SAM superfamily enzyme YgiQ (UPF0313 family)
MHNRSADIVFISPRNDSLGLFQRFVPRSIPIGVAILSGWLRKHGFSAEVADEDVVRIDRAFLEDRIKRMAFPRIFGLSVMTTNAGRAYETAKLIKSIDKSAVVVMGGIHPTVMPEEAMATGCVDFVVRGEGERALLALVVKLKAGAEDYCDIKGLVYLDKARKPVFNPGGDTFFDVDDLPPFPYDLFCGGHYDLGFILTSRGCPFDCIFCSQKVISRRKYRAVRTKAVVEELDRLVNCFGQKRVTFFDDYFTGDRERVFDLCAKIRARGLHRICSFHAQTRGNSVDRDLLTEMRRSGFDSLMLGFETASNRLMNQIKKKETVEDNIAAAKLATELGFAVEATFIFGFPGEMYRDRLEALLMARSLITRARFNNATPYPGTELYDIAVKERRINVKGCWENFSSVGAAVAGVFDGYAVPYSPCGTEPDDLAGEVFLANLLFYINISRLKKLLNMKRSVSGKWFEVPPGALLDPGAWFALLMLAFNVGLKSLYVLSSSGESRKFFVEGLFKSGRY